MIRRSAAKAFALAAGLAYGAGVLAQAPVTDAGRLDERLERIERLLDTDSLIKLYDGVEALRVETRELRGQLEVLSHAIDQLKQSQRDLYLDLDQRLQRLEAGGPPAVTSPPPQPSATLEAPASTAPAGSTTSTPTGTGATVTTGPETVATPRPASAPAATGTVPAQSAAGVDPFAEQQAYQGAFELLKAGRYEDAAEAFQQFLAAYPAGGYADNAQYWLGETYYITRNFELAVREFQRLISTYPNSGKLTHALLKIGYAHDELGNRSEAERALGDLVAQFPQSAAAGLARKRLQNIRR